MYETDRKDQSTHCGYLGSDGDGRLSGRDKDSC